MVTRAFVLFFQYCLKQSKIAVNLRAEVEVKNDPLCYVVRNIQPLDHGNSSAIPEVILMKKASVWVHLDSQRSTDLTTSIGKAIDAYEFK